MPTNVPCGEIVQEAKAPGKAGGYADVNTVVWKKESESNGKKESAGGSRCTGGSFERGLEQDSLAQAGETLFSHSKTHLSSQTSGQNESSPEVTEAVDEIGSGKASGSMKGDTRQSREKDGRC